MASMNKIYMQPNPVSAQAFRQSRLRMAVLSSAISKAIGMAAQVMSLSLVAHALGTSRYAAYLAVTASVAWASLLGFRFLPALTARISKAVARNDRAQEIALVSAGLSIALTAGGALMTLPSVRPYLAIVISGVG